MEMIAVELVGIWTKGDAEEAAGAGVDFAKEVSLGAALWPITQHAHALAIGERKSGDVDGIGFGVLALDLDVAADAAPDVAAGIAADMANFGHARAKNSLGGWLNFVRHPECQPCRHGAGRANADSGGAGLAHTVGVHPAAAIGQDPILDRRGGDLR